MWTGPRRGAALLLSPIKTVRVGENVWCFLIVRFYSGKNVTLQKITFIKDWTSVFEATVFRRVCVCLFAVTEPTPLGRAKPLDSVEDTPNYFLTRPHRLFHQELDHIEHAIFFHNMRDREQMFFCFCLFFLHAVVRAHTQPPQSGGILNPLGWCKSGQGQTCRFESCLWRASEGARDLSLQRRQNKQRLQTLERSAVPTAPHI